MPTLIMTMKCIRINALKTSGLKSMKHFSFVRRTMRSIVLFALLSYLKCGSSSIQCSVKRNVSEVALGLSEIINGLRPNCLTILTLNNSRSDDVDDFIYKIHELHLKTCIFFDLQKYFSFVETAITGSVESSSLIFAQPFGIVEEIHARNLAHRLSLFMFYWGAEKKPRSSTLRFEEPIRAVVITRPRKTALRVYYNQAIPVGKSNLQLVNWYDAESLGLCKTPLLPKASIVYSNFEGRLFYVPVIHSPPWHFVLYSSPHGTKDDLNNSEDIDVTQFKVIGGRDHYLLNLIANKMNFKFQYLDPQERTQGSAFGTELNASFSGGLGMVQNRQAQFLFGDIGLSWERRKAVEFSFFTLVDSGAFATHAPKRLNEALAIIRPFKLNVWPFLILTVFLSGPVFYLVIVIPYYWQNERHDNGLTFTHHFEYINEITLVKRSRIIEDNAVQKNRIPNKLFDKCMWFTLQLFLKQSCSELYTGSRARFLVIVYWIAATYVLSDVYSAQLTSQFARPARETPMDSLPKLEHAMKYRSYQLYVEKDSLSLEMLENSTEVFRRIYKLMRDQNVFHERECFLINSVEEGIRLISDGSRKAVLGGRETLYFNIKRYGLNNFQISRHLYTRYSAVAVQIGCPFLESFNNVLIHLFESGIIDKITSSEYEKMSAIKDIKIKDDKLYEINEYSKRSENIESDIQPLNLRMLQGAFIILLCGYSLAALVLLLEIVCYKKKIEISKLTSHAWYLIKKYYNSISRYIKRKIFNLLYPA